MIPYDFQDKLITGLGRKLTQGRRKVCGQLPTGGGKTVVFACVTDRYIKKSGKSVLIVVHRQELLNQTRKTLYNAFGIEAVAIKAGMKYIPEAMVYVAMVESLGRRIHKLKDIGMVIIDECHIASFNKIHQYFPEAYFIGFTATPLSSNKRKPVKMFYDDIVCGADIPELIKAGRLCQNMTWAPKEIVDRMELTIRGGEFDEQEMSAEFSRPKYINNTVSAYSRWALGTKTLVFNVNVEHSKAVNDAFVKAGYNSKHIDGNTPHIERVRIIDWFKHTDDAILCNVGITTVGFDEPTIETVIVNKATMSMPLWLQMCGRGSRPTLAKSAFTIIDMGGNAITHGDWSQPRDWETLFHNPPKINEEGVAPVKSCPGCSAIIPASAKVCPFCGYAYPANAVPIEIELYEFVLVTKNIDVEKIMAENTHRKDYYPFFQIARDLVVDFKKQGLELSDDYANFILLLYHEKGREWLKKYNEKKGLHKKYNQWHQTTAREYLFSELKKSFPKWQYQNQSAITKE